MILLQKGQVRGAMLLHIRAENVGNEGGWEFGDVSVVFKLFLALPT